MDLFDVLTLLGGLSLFLFGMNLMGASLEKRAGSSLKILLGKLTSRKMLGFLTGMGVTAVIQSSSATTVMVVGFVNSGLLTLRQAISVIMGANVGTTVTAWILSLTGLDGDNFFVMLLKPTSFTPILALIGVVLTMMAKSDKKKDVGMILLGFAVLMFGMDTMSGAVARPGRGARIPEYPLDVQQPCSGGAGRRGPDGDYPELLGLCGYFAGALCHGAGDLWRGDPHYHGAEHRHLRDGDDLLGGGQQERQASGCGASPL